MIKTTVGTQGARLAILVVASFGVTGSLHGQAAHNQLTERERAAGWQLLFDGHSLDQWRGFGLDEVPSSWRVVDGAIHFEPTGNRGDLMTREAFANFELGLEWRISPGGNSGIMFRVSEDGRSPWVTGPELQVLDNGGHRDGSNPLTSAGSNYAVHAPSVDATRPVGQWNHTRLVVDGSHVEHWLNGSKVVEYELWSDEWKTLVANTKFVEEPGYGLNRSGHIVLQDHNDVVSYRNVRIRRLP